MSNMVLTLSKREVLALRRFRNSNDTAIIKEILSKLLFLDSENFENTEASEELRLRVAADKRLVNILFDSELNLEEPSEQNISVD